MSRYSDYVARKRVQYGDKFSDASLAPQFADAYNNGERYRVLIDFGYGGAPVWGYVSVTTGWIPCFLLMRRRGQYGSSDTLNAECKILKSRWIK